MASTTITRSEHPRHSTSAFEAVFNFAFVKITIQRETLPKMDMNPIRLKIIHSIAFSTSEISLKAVVFDVPLKAYIIIFSKRLLFNNSEGCSSSTNDRIMPSSHKYITKSEQRTSLD